MIRFSVRRARTLLAIAFAASLLVHASVGRGRGPGFQRRRARPAPLRTRRSRSGSRALRHRAPQPADAPAAAPVSTARMDSPAVIAPRANRDPVERSRTERNAADQEPADRRPPGLRASATRGAAIHRPGAASPRIRRWRESDGSSRIARTANSRTRSASRCGSANHCISITPPRRWKRIARASSLAWLAVERRRRGHGAQHRLGRRRFLRWPSPTALAHSEAPARDRHRGPRDSRSTRFSNSTSTSTRHRSAGSRPAVIAIAATRIAPAARGT